MSATHTIAGEVFTWLQGATVALQFCTAAIGLGVTLVRAVRPRRKSRD